MANENKLSLASRGIMLITKQGYFCVFGWNRHDGFIESHLGLSATYYSNVAKIPAMVRFHRL